MKMKAYKTIKAILAIAMVCFSAHWTVEPAVATPMRGHTILIVPKQSPDDEPRTSVHLFIAELMDGSNSVLLGATDTIGTVSVQIISTAGDNYSTYFDTSDGAILLPVSGNTGYYTLTIITPDGTHYVGEFTI